MKAGHEGADIEAMTMRRIYIRLVPAIAVMIFIAVIDRTNIGVAALSMRQDIGLSAATFGLGATLFAVGYCLFELPSNLILVRVGARRWLARIMITWGLVTVAMALAAGPVSFLILRALLGLAEAGLTPGILFYVSLWFPRRFRALALGGTIIAQPVAGMIGNPISGGLMTISWFGLAGWQWMFIIEGLMAVILAAVPLLVLTDRPQDAEWLSRQQRNWLIEELKRDRSEKDNASGAGMKAMLKDLRMAIIVPVAICNAIAISAVSIWLPSIIKDVSQSSNLTVSLLSGIPFGCATLAMIGLSIWSHRSGRYLVVLLSTYLLGAISFLLLPGQSGPGAFILLCVATSTSLGAIPIFWALAGSFLSGKAAAAGLAMINILANIGSGIGPAVVGWLLDYSGDFSSGFLALALDLALAAGLILLAMVFRMFDEPAASNGR